MKFSAQEEYGVRCLIRLGKAYRSGKGLTIPEISIAEGISQHNVAKLLRTLRLEGYLESERGQSGGYSLTRSPDQIIVGDILRTLGGKLFGDEFCASHTGQVSICKNSIECSTRALWVLIQNAVDQVVNKLTLKDLMGPEKEILNQPDNSNKNNIEHYSLNTSF